MKKQFNIINRIFALTLVLMMALAAVLAVSAEALAENLTITIRNNEGLPAMKAGQFAAYQLFKGTPYKETEIPDPNPNVTENDWNADNWNNYTLADITWGDNINGKDLLDALKKLEYSGDTKWPEFFASDSHTNVFAGIEDTSADSAAEELANILVGKTNAFLQAFSKFVVSGNGEAESKGFLKGDPAKSTVSKGSETEKDPKDDESTIKVTDPGYYLIVEIGEQEKTDDAMSEYILAVLGDQTIDLKASVPTVDKNIVVGEGTSKGDAAGITDKVTFKLTGTLAKNFKDYDTYYYKFTDTLSKGLTYAGNVVVTVSVKNEDDTYTVYTIKNTEYKVTPETADTTKAPTADTTLTIEFENLLKAGGLEYTAVTGAPEGSDIAATGKVVLDANAVINVTYEAIVNENAVIGSEGNPNDVFITYSNDPNTDDKGDTHEEIVYVYAFGLDLVKKGSDNRHDDEGLEGASFTLKNEAGKYAKFEDATVEGKDGAETKVRRLAGWVDAEEVNKLVEAYKSAKKAYDKASNKDREGTAKTDLETAVKNLEAYILTSGSNGKIPDITGLDEGTYTLTEVITPDGYNTMDDITLTIDASFDTAGKLTKVDYTFNGATTEYTPGSADETIKGIFSSGLMPGTLVNQKAPFLPFTGGMGTTLFYIIGGFMIAGAVACIVVIAVRRRKQTQIR